MPAEQKSIRDEPWYRVFLKLAEKCTELEGRIYVLETGGVACPVCKGVKSNLCGTCGGKGILDLGEKMTNRWPEDTEDKMYLSWEYSESSLQDLIEQAQKKWFGIDFKDLYVSPTRIQTSGCGCHPAWDDYTSFIVLTRKKTPKEGE